MAARRRVRQEPSPPSPPEITWKVTHSIEPSKVDGHPLRLLNFSFRKGGRSFKFALPAEDGYELHADIGRAYDAVN